MSPEEIKEIKEFYEDDSIIVGKKARLKSGGPEMLITKLVASVDGPLATCTYANAEGVQQKSNFTLESLNFASTEDQLAASQSLREQYPPTATASETGTEPLAPESPEGLKVADLEAAANDGGSLECASREEAVAALEDVHAQPKKARHVYDLNSVTLEKPATFPLECRKSLYVLVCKKNKALAASGESYRFKCTTDQTNKVAVLSRLPHTV